MEGNNSRQQLVRFYCLLVTFCCYQLSQQKLCTVDVINTYDVISPNDTSAAAKSGGTYVIVDGKLAFNCSTMTSTLTVTQGLLKPNDTTNTTTVKTTKEATTASNCLSGIYVALLDHVTCAVIDSTVFGTIDGEQTLKEKTSQLRSQTSGNCTSLMLGVTINEAVLQDLSVNSSIVLYVQQLTGVDAARLQNLTGELAFIAVVDREKQQHYYKVAEQRAENLTLSANITADTDANWCSLPSQEQNSSSSTSTRSTATGSSASTWQTVTSQTAVNLTVTSQPQQTPEPAAGNNGVIYGIVFGVIGGICSMAALVVVAVYLYRWRRSQLQYKVTQDEPADVPYSVTTRRSRMAGVRHVSIYDIMFEEIPSEMRPYVSQVPAEGVELTAQEAERRASVHGFINPSFNLPDLTEHSQDTAVESDSVFDSHVTHGVGSSDNT